MGAKNEDEQCWREAGLIVANMARIPSKNSLISRNMLNNQELTGVH